MDSHLSTDAAGKPTGNWERYVTAFDDVNDRLQWITTAMDHASVPFALVGGQAVAMWVASKYPAAVRTTKGIEILVNRGDSCTYGNVGLQVYCMCRDPIRSPAPQTAGRT